MLKTMLKRIAPGVAGRVGRQRLLRSGDAEPTEHVERLLALTMCRQIARRFRQREAEHPDDQRADADQNPDATLCVFGRIARLPTRKHDCRSDRPHAGAPDEMNNRQDATANAFGRIFARVSEGKRLLGAEAKAGDEAAGNEQRDARGTARRGSCEDAEQQQIELVDESAPEPVAEFTLARQCR